MVSSFLHHHQIMLLLKVKVKSLSRVRILATPWTVACQAPLSMEFSRQKYWSGLPFPSPGKAGISGLHSRLPRFLPADTLKPYSQKTSQSNHTRTTALSNSVKLSHALWGHPRWVGHGGEVQYSCLENPMDGEPGRLQSRGSLRVGHD